MKNIILVFFIILRHLTQYFGNATVINLLTYSFASTAENLNQTESENAFKKYMEKKT